MGMAYNILDWKKTVCSISTFRFVLPFSFFEIKVNDIGFNIKNDVLVVFSLYDK